MMPHVVLCCVSGGCGGPELCPGQMGGYLFVSGGWGVLGVDGWFWHQVMKIDGEICL